ncbi:glycosyltransferase family 4 protein [Hanstruepera marina]|uniref:glycosyltransferase family 4 protein n=1 Tax=Hanstruepera marina TaxID=2873265 RepID=UPI001CA64B52|nr:glycosyltransferase family 4 protein [Hanstruepera marina]
MAKRICFVGGEDVHKRIPLSKHLIQAGYHVTIIGTSTSQFPEQIRYYNYNLVRHFSPTSDYKTIKWLRNYFGENQFDIIHTFDTKPAFLVPLALKNNNTPITRTITGLGTLFMSNNISSSILRIAYKQLHKNVQKRVFKTVFQNLDDYELYLKNNLVKKENCELIYSSGIDLTEFKDKAARKQNPFTFICVARLVYEKGIINYLEAAKICNNRKYDFKFLLVGPLEEDSKKLNKQILNSYNDIVSILGARTDIIELLLKSDAFVLPTFREGFSRVLLEAAAVGLPIVSTNVTGVRDFVTHKKEALLVEPQDSETLAESMIEIATNTALSEQLVKNALKKVETYSIENVSKQYIAIFDNAIN